MLASVEQHNQSKVKNNVCTVCLDILDSGDLFCCPSEGCEYSLCTPCVKIAFEDLSGESYTYCPMCKTAIARDILYSILGRGAVRAVEDELRNKVEFDVAKKTQALESSKQNMNEYRERARVLFNLLSEELNMKCPRCKQVFYDYSGCNALACSNVECREAFCAICLADCGDNAHPHVQQKHGNLFDREGFEVAKKVREDQASQSFFDDHKEEPYEVIQLVKSLYEDSQAPTQNGKRRTNRTAERFLADAKLQFYSAVRNDRLGILKDPSNDSFRQNGLEVEDVSPRNVIPSEYKLELDALQDDVYKVKLWYKRGNDVWNRENLRLFDDTEETERRKVDALCNVVQSLKCGILAFQGARCLYQSTFVSARKNERKLGDDEVSIRLRAVMSTGDVVNEGWHPTPLSPIIGINQNQRFFLFESHVRSKNDDALLVGAIRDYVGNSDPRKVFSDIEVPAPSSFEELNDQQKRVAHPLCLISAMEVAGPPGTGKTKTITELISCVLECTSAHTLVLSERNGAIDAIAKKFVRRCLSVKKNGLHTVVDIPLWENLVVYGTVGGLGTSARLFTIDEKIRYHPELVELRRDLDRKRKQQRRLAEKMRNLICDRLMSLMGDFSSDALHARSRAILSGTEAGFQQPNEILYSLLSLLDDARRYLRSGGNIDDLLANHNSFLNGLISSPEKSIISIFFNRNSKQRLEAIFNGLSPLLNEEAFSTSYVENFQRSLRDLEEGLGVAEARVSSELGERSRIWMSTIGSSHRLPAKGGCTSENVDVQDLADGLTDMRLSDEKTIVIFDEAGCIPAYELLGLSRLGLGVDAIVAVGDKHQLPPYNPHQTSFPKKTAGHHRPFRQSNDIKKIDSILDVSGASDLNKVNLINQYRVPRDIASVLNARIYKGEYKTPTECKVPRKGFFFVDVPPDRDEKYVNRNEIRMCMELIHQIDEENKEPIVMVLTPYKKQQRELQFRMKREGLQSINVLTIDQCQGQEADWVLLSLVQKPTKFLDKHRFNVALSRVRKRLYLLTSRHEFQKASQDTSWECSLLAKDLLEISADYEH